MSEIKNINVCLDFDDCYVELGIEELRQLYYLIGDLLGKNIPYIPWWPNEKPYYDKWDIISNPTNAEYKVRLNDGTI